MLLPLATDLGKITKEDNTSMLSPYLRHMETANESLGLPLGITLVMNHVRTALAYVDKYSLPDPIADGFIAAIQYFTKPVVEDGVGEEAVRRWRSSATCHPANLLGVACSSPA